MSTRTLVELIDDIDGEAASETIGFGVDGTSYEIDLSEENAEALRDVLQPYIEAGRRISGSRPKPRSASSANAHGNRRAPARSAPADSSQPTPRTVREWARENGIQVTDRGRIPEAVTAAYRAAHR